MTARRPRAVSSRSLPFALTALALTACDFLTLPVGEPPPADMTIATAGPLVTTERGGTATFSLALGSRPTGDVVLAVSSSNTAEGEVSPAQLTFTSTTWNVPQEITVTGVDDFVVDGDQRYQVVFAPAQSLDGRYNGYTVPPLDVVNLDKDRIGILVTPTDGLVTTTAGTVATFTIVLESKPAADVTIGLSSSDPAAGTVHPASVTFTADNWKAPQIVTVAGGTTVRAVGGDPYTIVTAPAVSADPAYAGLDPADVAVTNRAP